MGEYKYLQQFEEGGMCVINFKQKIDISKRRVCDLGAEYTRSKDDAVCRQKLNLMFCELSAQIVCLSEQNVELMRKLEKQK